MKIKQRTEVEIEIKFPIALKKHEDIYYFSKEGLNGLFISDSIISNAPFMFFEKDYYPNSVPCTIEEAEQMFNKTMSRLRKSFITVSLDDNLPTEFLEQL